MKYAIIDTETSGLFDFSKPADADGQPRLASLAIILLDEKLNETARQDMLIKPDGWRMSPEVIAVNGLTNERLEAEGIPIAEALDVYTRLVDQGYAIVAFNAQFDTKVVRGELRRAGLPDRFETTPNICVMRASTELVKMPKKSGGGYKFPKLSEACVHFGIKQANAHSAMGDAIAAMEVFRALKARGACPDPEVHYATNRPAPVTAAHPTPAPVASQEIGANNPPGPIDDAKDEYEKISAFLKNNPIVGDHETARLANDILVPAKSTIKALETAEGLEADPLYAEWKAVKAKWKPAIESMKKVVAELAQRLGDFMRAEDDRRKAEAERVRKEAEAAEAAAREAERLEAEARENASLGEIGADVGGAIAQADAAFADFQIKEREARIAEKDSTVRFKSRFADKATTLRTNRVLILKDAPKALDAVGITDRIRDAILTEARAFRKDFGSLPDGVVEIEERVL